LDGKRSSLFYEAVRIIKEMRCATDGKYPRWICWENVPGAFSSNSRARTSEAVLEAVIGIVEPNAQVPMPEKAQWPYADLYMGDGWSVAYRTLDAQYWGVPQRRKRRIYLVADFAGRSASEKYYLSQKACLGILRRASVRGKELPEVLTPCVGARQASVMTDTTAV
jgi:DNA (cytosine-5)-methyltransferase 1